MCVLVRDSMYLRDSVCVSLGKSVSEIVDLPVYVRPCRRICVYVCVSVSVSVFVRDRECV